MACGKVELGYGPPCVVPYWKDAFTVPAVPRFIRVPFTIAEFEVTEPALPVDTEGGTLPVVKLISLP
jgi:hypothetical protein